MNEKNMIQLKDSITMPTEMSDALLQNCSQSHRKHNRYSRYSKICAVLAALFCITAIGSTSYAAYNAYQEKQLAIFISSDLTQEEKAALGEQLAQMPEISSCLYISGDEAWEEFKANYLTEEIALYFTENPLKDSDNYQVSIRLGADTQAVRDKISQLDGVRKITTLRDLDAMQTEEVWVNDRETGEPTEVWVKTGWFSDEESEESTDAWVTLEWYTSEELDESVTE